MDTGDKYLDVTYGSKPFTDYPPKLASQLANQFSIQPGQRLLDLGCGRGEMASAFQGLGFDVTGFDQASPTVDNFSFEFMKGDLSKGLEGLRNQSFDVVFSKSVIEHFYYPEHVLSEAFRVLKPGGLVVTMTPSWRHNYKMFFDDFTHRTPFTLDSISEIHQFAGFESVTACYFLQLPVTWRYRGVHHAALALGSSIPDKMKLSKTLRFSKEVMLLSTGLKPN